MSVKKIKLLSNIDENLSKIYTPAETSVAECIKADAGTGAAYR